MRCCAECFGDEGLARIFSSKTSEVGRCDFCRTEDTLVADPASFSDVFQSVTNIYEEDAEGRDLYDWLQADWGLFKNTELNKAAATTLLARILDEPELLRRRYSPSSAFETMSLRQWEDLSSELKTKNRYFPNVEIEFSRLAELFAEHLRADQLAPDWYRARICPDGAPFELREMGAPPPSVATHGRANPAGIPYLYLASNERTATSEIRPHTGETASVAEFAIPDGLAIVDLRDPKRKISPFELGDENAVGKLRGDIDLLERLGRELTRPVRPQAAAVEYVPSQYLCEFIKKSKYQSGSDQTWDGVLYRSSVGDGVNLALFDPDKAVGRQVTTWQVERVTVEIGRSI